MPGAAAGALIFFMLLAGAVIVGLIAWTIAAHLFLSVVEGTAAGADEVHWPNEPYVDWLWKAVFVAWIAAIWLIPAGIIGRVLSEHTAAFWAFGIVWWVSSISLLSAMGSSSRWFVLSPTVLGRLLRGPGSFLTFAVLTALLAAAAALAAWGTFASARLVVTPLAAFVLACAVLIHGRLCGRLAHIVADAEAQTAPAPAQSEVRREPRRAVQVEAAAYDPVRAGRQRIRQPSELPPTNAPDPEARTGYNVRLDDDPPADSGKPPGHGWIVHDPPTPYELAVGPADVAPPRGPMPEHAVNPSDYERHLARSIEDKIPDVPNHPWLAGTWSFPFRRNNAAVLATLTTVLTGFGWLIKLMVQMSPA
jgi:hypothetical protein